MIFGYFKSIFLYCVAIGIGGGGGSSSSKTTTTNTSTQAGIGDGALGIFGSENTVQMLDGGAIEQAFGFGGKVLQTSENVFEMATNASVSNYGKLLESTSGAMDKMIKFGSDSQKNAAALVDTANSKGSIDNKTIMILGGGALLAVAMYFMRRKAA